jgi:hypothetical protein
MKSAQGGVLVKSSLNGDVSEKPMMGMLYPFSADTLTCIKLIVRCVSALMPPYPNDSP